MITAIIVAHPDDEVLGCGATAARLTAEGMAVHIRILGEGITSRAVTADAADRDAVARLRKDAAAAGARLGAASVEIAAFPDNRFDTVALLDVVHQVERWLNDLRPGAVYTHHPGDLNVDHAITARAVMTATRPQTGHPVREVYACEVPSATDWSFQRFAPAFRPNVFHDVTATIDAKIEAMECYASERRAFPHPRAPEALRALAQRWGAVVGVGFAEAFELMRAVR